VAIVTTVEPAHLEFFGSVEAIADAKAEIFEGLEPGGVAVLNRDNPLFARLERKAVAAGARVIGFGADEAAACRLVEARLEADGSDVRAIVNGRPCAYRLGPAGRHWVMNSLAVLAAVDALGGDVSRAAAALADLAPPGGRGARHPIAAAGGAAVLIDESYNANPASVRAALDVLGRIPGRRIAVLGDMRELGPDAPALHAGLAGAVEAAGVARLYTCGPLMEALFAAVPANRRGAHAADSQALLPLVVSAVRAGDVVLVKGSLGSRMAPIVDALRAGAAPAARRAG
jgi:UDP-N-acetylmuramoyl-tripeptide--D-alanyl-D-alanine ligase